MTQSIRLEHCDECGRETDHDVVVSVLTESNKSENAAFSREPYRKSVCQDCGHEESIRMNNA